MSDDNYLVPDVVALVPAAGLGARLGLGPKAFLTIDGLTLIERVVAVLRPRVRRVLVALPSSHLDQAPTAVLENAEVHPGEDSRHLTVRSLLQKCDEPVVLIQDVSRPFASPALIERVIRGAIKHGAAATFIKTHIPVARCKGQFVVETYPRQEMRLSQTPLAFRRELLEEAYALAERKGIETQATFELVLMLGKPVFAVEGEELNLKVATPLEWEVARTVGWKALMSKVADRAACSLE